MPAPLPWLVIPALLGMAANPEGGAQEAQLVPDAGVVAPAEDPISQLLAEADALYARRDEPGQLDGVESKLREAEKLAPDDYRVLWRLSRLLFWRSDDPTISDDERSRIGKTGWDYGERAVAKNPNGVEGYFFAAGGMGNYSLGIGVLKALSQGIEGKFRDRLGKAEKLEPNFLDGGIENAWGRFYFKLPWPKYNAEKSELHLLRAMRVNPNNVRGRVFLAELYMKEDHPKEAKQQLEKALANPPGRYDAPEERRYQQRARALLSRLH